MCIHIFQRFKPTTAQDSHFDFDEFQQYLGVGGNRSTMTAIAIVNDVKLFFNLTPNSSKSTDDNKDKLFNHKYLEHFYHSMKKELQYAPSTIAEKLKRLKKAMEFVAHQQFSDITLHQTATRYKDLLNVWINSLSKLIALHQQRSGIHLSNEVAQTSSPDKYLENKEVRQKVANAQDNLRRGMFHIQDVKLLTAFSAAIIVYKNGQRPGVVDNLTINEFEL